jgi:hypothetical protein
VATYVLIHGAYQGGWIWQPVTTRLREPSLEGCAERHHQVRHGITVGTHAREVAQHELDTGHYPMLSAPGELTRLLLK